MSHPSPRALGPISALTVLTSLTCTFDAGAATPEEASKAPAAPVQLIEKIVVTGSYIPDTTPAGQKLITIEQEDIQRSGFKTAQDLLRSLPQNFNGGTTESSNNSVGGHQPNPSSTSRQSVPNLRGASPEATLVLIDGRRIAGAGTRGVLSDISTIPLAAVERVEILADGASALYGSDAVGGVINFILRKNFDGAQSAVHLGGGNDGDQHEIRFSQIFGHEWRNTSALAAVDYFDRDPLLINDRDRSSGDLRPYGGSDFRVATCNPGTLTATDTNGTATYAIPTGQNGTALNLATLTRNTRSFCSRLNNGMEFPDERQWNALVKLKHQLNDRLGLLFDAQFNDRRVFLTSVNNTLTLTVPTANPFRPVGAIGNVSVAYDISRDLGPLRTESDSRTWSANVGADVDLGASWTLIANTGPARAREHQFQSLLPTTGAGTLLTAALGAGTAATAFNPFADGSNTNAAVLQSLYDSNVSTTDIDSNLWLSSVIVRGQVFNMPGGAVRLAIGADRRDQTLDAPTINIVRRVANTVTTVIPGSFERDVTAGFAELFVPVIGRGNAKPGLRRLEFSLAGRHEHYSDVGNKTVPRFGVTWAPIESVAVRGSWSKSFKAPALVDLDAGNLLQNGSGITTIFDGGVPVNGLIIFGNNAALRPENAESWTVGFDIDPELTAGVRISATYFDTDYTDRISGTPDFGLLTAANEPFVIRNPTPAQRAQACSIAPQYTNFFTGSTTDCLTVPIAAISDGRLQNLAALKIRGVDIDLGYDWQTRAGQLRADLNASRMFEYGVQATETSPRFNFVSTEGDPVKFRARASLGWDMNAWSADAFVNYVTDYQDTISIPNRAIGSWTTLDLNFAYRFDSSSMRLLDGSQVSLSVRNAFDKDPPFFNGSAVSGSYDATNANFQGRVFGLDLRKSW